MTVSDTQATRALAANDITSSTRAMPRTSYASPAPTARRAYAETAPPPQRRDRRDAARPAGRRTGSFFALLLVLAAVAAVAIAVLASTQGDTNVQAPDANDVEQQINELRDFIRENAR